jgi:hypothetical protein
MKGSTVQRLDLWYFRRASLKWGDMRGILEVDLGFPSKIISQVASWIDLAPSNFLSADHLIHPTSNVRGDCCSSMPWWMRWSCGMYRMYCKKSPRNGMVSWNDFPTWIKKRVDHHLHTEAGNRINSHIFFGWFYPSQQKSVKKWFSKSLMAGMLISCSNI